jgi:hypothetical protein
MENNYKVVFIPKMGEQKFEKVCQTIDEAEQILESIADYTLMLHEASLMPDYSNMGYVLKRIDGEWVEVDADENEI